MSDVEKSHWYTPVDLPEFRPWDLLPDEPVEYHNLFEKFYLRLPRSMGSSGRSIAPRDLQELLGFVNEDGSRVCEWSGEHLRKVASKYRWEERAAAFDREYWEEEWQGDLDRSRQEIVVDYARLVQELLRQSNAELRRRTMREMSDKDFISVLDLVSRQVHVIAGAQQLESGGVGVGDLVSDEAVEELRRAGVLPEEEGGG